MPFSKQTANTILRNNTVGKYVALFTAAPTDTGTTVTFSEVSGGSYARAKLTQDNMDNASMGSIQNRDLIFFPEATASWGTVTHFGIFDVATGGQPLIYGELTSSVTISANYVPLFRAGMFRLTLA